MVFLAHGECCHIVLWNHSLFKFFLKLDTGITSIHNEPYAIFNSGHKRCSKLHIIRRYSITNLWKAKIPDILCALDRKVLYNIYISKYTIDRWNVFIWHYYDSCWLNIVARIWDGLIYDPMVSHKKTSFKLKFRRFPEFFRMVGNTEWDTVLQRKLQSNNITLCRYLYRWLCGCWWLCPSYTV